MRIASPLRGARILSGFRGTFGVFILSVGLNLAQWAYLVLRVRPQSEPIPLHYTIAFGIDRIGPWFSAFLLPASGTAIVMANIVLVSMVVEHQRVTAQLIVVLTLLMELTLLTGAMLTFRQV